MKSNEQKTDVKETVAASFDIPSRIYLFGRRPANETKEIVVEHLRNQAMSICDLLVYGAACVQSGNFDEKIFVESVGVLANIASNHIEAIEIVERDKDGEMARASLPEESKKNEKPPIEMTLSAMIFNRMADRLITIIDSPDVPESSKDAIMSIVYTAVSSSGDDATTGEYIKNNFVRSMESFSLNAANAYIDSLQAVMESCIPDEIYTPILKANVEKFDGK